MAGASSNIDRDADDREFEWREAYEESIAARADYQALARSAATSADTLDAARERLDRAEALKARVLARIERLEQRRRASN